MTRNNTLRLILASTLISGCGGKGDPDLTRIHPFDSRFEALVNPSTLTLTVDATARNNYVNNFDSDPQWNNSFYALQNIDELIFSLMFNHNGLLPNANYEIALLSRGELEQARDFHQNIDSLLIPEGFPTHQFQNLGNGFLVNEVSVGRVPYGKPAGISQPLTPIINDISPDYGIDKERFMVEQGTCYEVVLRVLKAIARNESVDHTSPLSSSPSLTIAAGTAPNAIDADTRLYSLDEARMEASARRFIPQAMQNNTGQKYQITIHRQPTNASQLAQEIFAAERKQNETAPLSRVYDLDQAHSNLGISASQAYTNYLTSPFTAALSALRGAFGSPGYLISKIGFQNIYDVRVQD